jgi:hypothetical protein
LYLRYQAGIVTDEMLSLPQKPFLAVGLFEALAAATGMAAGGNFLKPNPTYSSDSVDIKLKYLVTSVSYLDAIIEFSNSICHSRVTWEHFLVILLVHTYTYFPHSVICFVLLE